MLQRQGVSPTFRPTSVTHCLGRETTRVVVPRRCSRLGKTTIILLRIYYFWKGESGRGEVFSSHTLERPRAGRCKSLATHPARDGRCIHTAAPALGPFLRQAGAVISSPIYPQSSQPRPGSNSSGGYRRDGHSPGAPNRRRKHPPLPSGAIPHRTGRPPGHGPVPRACRSRPHPTTKQNKVRDVTLSI